MQQYKMSQQQQQMQQMKQMAHNGQNNHNKRRCSKVPVRELPEAMPKYQHPIYPQLYCVQEPSKTCYKWDCIILDLDRTIIHGKRLSVKRWRKYVENGTIPSLAENQCSKWHRHIHRKGHQMHPFIRGRTMIYYRPFTWHLLAVLDYLKSHFGTKIIICTKAGEHYAASVLAALISNFTSANPDLIDDVYNFHDLHDDEEDEGKPKKPFRLICNRHNLDPKKTLIVDDNATSWFDADRLITNFWMPPCYGYQIHDIDNELQLLCKYLWDPIQQNHLKKKTISLKQQQQQVQSQSVSQQSQPEAVQKGIDNQSEEEKRVRKYQEEEKPKHHNNNNHHSPQHSQVSESTDSLVISPNGTPKREYISRQSPKSISSNTLSPKNNRFLASPKKHGGLSPNHSPKHMNELSHYPATPNNNTLQFNQSISSLKSSSYSITSTEPESSEQRMMSPNHHHISNHNKQNAVDKIQFNQLLADQQAMNAQAMNADDDQKINVTSMSRIARNYNKRKYKDQNDNLQNGGLMILDMSPSAVSTTQSSSNSCLKRTASKSPKSPATKTKKKGYFFESKSRGSKKLAKIIGK